MLHPRRWKSDKSSVQCTRCATLFSLLRRRHHCRHCGGVFCDNCSEQRLWLRPWPVELTRTVWTAALQDEGIESSSANNAGGASLSAVSSSSQTSGPTGESSFFSDCFERVAATAEGLANHPAPSTACVAASRSLVASISPVTCPTLFAPPQPVSLQGIPHTSTSAIAATATTAAVADPHHHGRHKLAETSRTSAVGLTSSSTEPESHAEDGAVPLHEFGDSLLLPASPCPTSAKISDRLHKTAGEASQGVVEEHQQGGLAVPRTPSALIGVVSDSTMGSRQVSEALLAASLCSVSPTTAPGDVTPQTWSTPAAVPGLDRASASWPCEATFGTGTTDAALVDSLRDGGEESSSSRVMAHPEVSATAPSASAPRSTVVDRDVASAYQLASYRVEVDQRHITWYLCRVCIGCYDALLDTILDAHEHSPLLPPQEQQRRPRRPSTTTSAVAACPSSDASPLWQHIRITSSNKTRHTRLASPSIALSPTVSARPPLSSAWARLCAAASLPTTPVTSGGRASPTAVRGAATSSVVAAAVVMDGADACVLPPPALRPRDLSCVRDASVSGRCSRTPSTADVPPALVQRTSPSAGRATGVAGLPVPLYGASSATAATAMAASEGSISSSPTTITTTTGHLGEASILSVSSSSFPHVSRQSADVTSPKQQQPQQRVQRAVRTPPRRRLISIGNSAGHVRQAVAIARRRRRIAVILIDEREANADGDEGTLRDRGAVQRGSASRRASRQQLPFAVDAGVALSPCGSPVGFNREAASFVERPEAPPSGGASRTSAPIATPVGAALPAMKINSLEGDSSASAVGSPVAACSADFHSEQRRAGAPKASLSSAKQASLSIFVDVEGENEGSSQGLSPGDWLLPTLPIEAATTMPATTMTHNSFTTVVAHKSDRAGDAASPCVSSRLLQAAEVSAALAETALAATSRPISCAGGGAATTTTTATNATPKLTPASAAAAHHRVLPAITLLPEAGALVLSALFSEVGAAPRLAATPVVNALTPTAAAAAAAAASGGLFPVLGGNGGPSSLFMDPSLPSAVTPSGWGTGPESYALQRHALVREMLLRQQRTSAAAGAAGHSSSGGLTSPSFGVSNATSSGTFNNNTNNNGSVGTATATAPHTGIGGFNGSCGGAGQPAISFNERVTVPVNVFFQVRSPMDNAGAAAPSAAASAILSLSLLPVTTQVEMVGIPVDVTAASANTSPKTALSPTLTFNGPRTVSHVTGGGGGGSGGGGGNGSSSLSGSMVGAAGVSRPLTLAEFLPQLAKLSTNLDGYLVVVLRSGRRRSSAANATTSPLGKTTSASDESPLTGATGRRTRFNSFSGDGVQREKSVRLTEDGSGNARSDSFTLDYLTASSGGPSAAVAASLGGTTRCRAARRRHRVTEFFGGPQLRLLYQQLQSCGVTQPAISVVDVCEEDSSDAGGSPASTIGISSPQGERSGLQDENAGNSSMPSFSANAGKGTAVAPMLPLEALHESPSSPLNPALSPVSPRSSSSQLLVPVVQNSAGAIIADGNRKHGQPERLDALILPSSLYSTREGPSSADFTAATATNATATAMTPTNTSAAHHREQHRLAAQEHAAASLRATAHQLGLPISNVHYPTRPTTATGSCGGGNNGAAESPLRASHGSAGGSKCTGEKKDGSCATSTALLSRGLESLMATMVHRDLSAQQ